MCVWYNITQTMRMKVEILRKFVDGMGSVNAKFPNFDLEEATKIDPASPSQFELTETVVKSPEVAEKS